MLSDHSDEVWYLKFSHNGTRLASGSRNGDIIIWNVGVSSMNSHVTNTQMCAYSTYSTATEIVLPECRRSCISFKLQFSYNSA